MIHLIEGRQGSGKTLLLVKKAKEYYTKGYKIYSNVHLNNIPYIPLNYDDIINCNISKALVIIDEVHLLLPSRNWYKKSSMKIVDTFLSQIRKREIELYCTTQFIRKVDIRLREEADFIYYCSKYVKKNKEFVLCTYDNRSLDINTLIIIHVDVYDRYDNNHIEFSFKGNEYYKEYDTSQIININIEGD